jgi:Clostridial hydrophobic W/Secretion system C-terminal sorting domain/Ricin-type beta-trefoil lectin domain-like
MKQVNQLPKLLCIFAVLFFAVQSLTLNAQSIFYQTHVTGYGWLGLASDGATSGTTGETRQMEAIRISLQGFQPTTTIRYRVHMQDAGWSSFVHDGATAGTVGLTRRMEAIQIDLIDNPHGNVEYRVHISGLGWTTWTPEGGIAGTVGLGRAIEAIQIRFVAARTWANVERGNYIITSQMIDKNIDVMWGQNANGVRLHLWPTNNDVAQMFTIVPSGEAGYYFIKTNWGRSLGINGGVPNGDLITWDSRNIDDQKWRFIAVGGGYYNIQSKLGTYMDLTYGQTADGSGINMSAYSTWNKNTAQRWKLSKVYPTFKHTANASGSHVSPVNHSLTNSNSDALLFTTSDYGSGGPYHTKTTGVWYNGSQWTIYNQDLTPMPAGSKFNVLISEPSANAFMHTATSPTGHITIINHPRLNNNPNARLLVTQNWGSAGPYNPNPIGVYYTGTNWAIFNQNFAAMPLNAKFNILLSDQIFEVAAPAPASSHIVTIDRTVANDAPHRTAFATQLWRGVYNANEVGVWYNGSRWTVYNQNRATMPASARFFVMAATYSASALPFSDGGESDGAAERNNASEETAAAPADVTIKAYPNPATDRLSIAFPEALSASTFEASVWDQNGKCVMLATQWAANEAQQIEVKTWPNGIYTLRLADKTGKPQVVRFVKAD